LSELLTQVKIWLEKAENALKVNEQNFDFSNLPKIKFVDKQ
ncbi:hypothetical protein JGI23_01848, partial [Candidatus Chrysopegis kryptomonas]